MKIWTAVSDEIQNQKLDSQLLKKFVLFASVIAL